MRLQGAQSPTALIRLRVIHMLGALGGQVNQELAASDSEALKKAVAWDTQKRLEFVLPFQDLKPSVFLGVGQQTCSVLGTYCFLGMWGRTLAFTRVRQWKAYGCEAETLQ